MLIRFRIRVQQSIYSLEEIENEMTIKTDDIEFNNNGISNFNFNITGDDYEPLIECSMHINDEYYYNIEKEINSQGIVNFIENEFTDLFDFYDYDCTLTILEMTPKTKQNNCDSWGKEMDRLLRKGSPNFMNSPLSKNNLIHPQIYQQKTGNIRKIFILEEES